MADLAELQAEHDRCAEAIGVFEAEFAANEAEWKARRVEVNDVYKAADAALQEVQNGLTRTIADAATAAASRVLAQATATNAPINETIKDMIAAALAAATEAAPDVNPEILEARANASALACFTGAGPLTIAPDGVASTGEAGEGEMN